MMHVPSQIMRQFQSMTRSGEARDFNLIQDNSAYVQNWSIAQAIVVILCTAVQVDGLSLFPFLYIIIVAGVLCQELLQRSKGRERGWQWVQDEDLMLVKKFWLCFNRYSRPLCQCVLGVHSVLYRWQIQISRKFVHIPVITKYQRGTQPIYTDIGLEVKEMVESAPWAIIKSTSIYIAVWQSVENEEYRKRKTWRVDGEMVGKWASKKCQG